MTRKDYQLIAAAIKEAQRSHNRSFGFAMQELCDRLKKDNPRFDRDKFLEACGI